MYKFDKLKNYVFFKTMENSGVIGVVGNSKFINHKQLNFCKLDKSESTMINNLNKKVFKNGKFHLNEFIKYNKLYTLKWNVHPNFLKNIKKHENGKYYIVLAHMGLEEFFDENEFEKIYVYRNPLIALMCAFDLAPNFKVKYFIEDVQYFQSIKETVNYVNYEDVLGKDYSKIDEPSINKKNYLDAKEILNKNNIKYNDIFLNFNFTK